MSNFFKDNLQFIVSLDADVVIFHVFFLGIVYQSNWKRLLTSTLKLLNADDAVTTHEVLWLHMLHSTINM